MDIHIGRLIEERINEVGMSKAEFGRRINTSRQNVNTLLRKASLDTTVLSQIGKVLNHDFFRYYSSTRQDTTLERSSEAVPSVKLVITLPPEMQKQILLTVLGESGGNLADWL